MSNSTLIAGADEVGRGCLAGPVVAACVILPDQFCLPALTDSKLLNAKKRNLLAEEIKQQALSWCIASSSREEIDQFNILEASKLAIIRAIEGLGVKPTSILIDGNMKFPTLSYNYQSVVNGDFVVPSISAASIIAKVYRDALMRELSHIYPGYGWESNAGYGTKKHLLALDSIGITPEHRLSFAPVALAKSKCMDTVL